MSLEEKKDQKVIIATHKVIQKISDLFDKTDYAVISIGASTNRIIATVEVYNAVIEENQLINGVVICKKERSMKPNETLNINIIYNYDDNSDDWSVRSFYTDDPED